MEKVSTPSLCSLPVTCLTAAVQTITTSWKTSSCESDMAAFYMSLSSCHELIIVWCPFTMLYTFRYRDKSCLVSSAGMWWAVWRCLWLKITWSSTWMEPLLGVRCLGSAGSRNVTRWLTEGEKIAHNKRVNTHHSLLTVPTCYLCCDGRLRKNLKSLVIAHPTWFIRTVLAISRPFIRWRTQKLQLNDCRKTTRTLFIHIDFTLSHLTIDCKNICKEVSCDGQFPLNYHHYNEKPNWTIETALLPWLQ